MLNRKLDPAALATGLIEKRAVTDGETTGERQMRYVASDETTDRYGDQVAVSGWQLAEFRRNPIFLLGHDYSSPIGLVPTIAVEGKRLMATVEFAAPGVSQLADDTWKLAEANILRAVSVGFQVDSPDDYELIRDADNNVTGYRFLKQTLLELSLVAVPANPNSLAVARSLGLSESLIRRVLPLDASILQRQAEARARLHRVKIAGIALQSPRQALTHPNKGVRP